jgi:hypothetical protein
MSQNVELPEKVWSALQQAAKASGMTPAGWIASHLPTSTRANGVSDTPEKGDIDDLEPPSYTSLSLERVGVGEALCIGSKELQPLPFSVEDLTE